MTQFFSFLFNSVKWYFAFALLILGLIMLNGLAHGETLDTWNGKGEPIKFFIGNQYVENLCAPKEQACHLKVYTPTGIEHHIALPDDPFQYTHPGCNFYTHEVLHAWGYNEQMIRDFFDCRGSQFSSLPLLNGKID